MNSFVLLLATTFAISANVLAAEYKPLLVPTNVLVSSSSPRQTIWSGLTKKEQSLAKHLLSAAKAGEPIIYWQNHRHGLLIKSVIEKSLNAKNLPSTKKFLGDSFLEYLNYSAKFEDQSGPYSPANRKYVLRKTSAMQVAHFFKQYAAKTDARIAAEAVRLMTDEAYEVISRPEDAEGTNLENSGGNMYEHGLTGAEVAEAVRNGLNSNLNCRIIRAANGSVNCDVQALNNPALPQLVRRALEGVVRELELALPYATTKHQSSQITYLIKFLRTGDVEDFRQMNIEWVKDRTNSKVDFMMGFVEVYQDYLNQIGAWESYVQIVDPTTTQLSINLAQHAQTFENNMPYGEYKKTFPADYSPPAMMVYYFQELSAFRSGGYNLPNFDDIRRDVGAKNVIRLDLPGLQNDPTTLAVRRELFEEFLVHTKVEGVLTDWPAARRALVLLHEIIGHGSGTYNIKKYPGNEDPVGALGSLGSSLEEQRADQAALVFAADPVLVKIGFYKDQAEATRVRNAMYDSYLAIFLRDIAKQQSLSEAHHRGHWLLLNKLFEANAIEKTSRDGAPLTNENLVLNVKDYELFYKVSYDLLAELQRIKAERDEPALKEIYKRYAPLESINEPWMQAVIARGIKLKAYAGEIQQPWVLRKNTIVPLGERNKEGLLTLEGIAPYFGK